MTDLITLLEPFAGWIGVAVLLLMLLVNAVTDDPPGNGHL